MIKAYLNQTAILHRTLSLNVYGESAKTKKKKIPVRWEGKRRIVRDNQGREVVSEARVFCVEPVQPGDLLEYAGREWPAIAVSIVPGLDGKESHREVAI